MKFVGLFAIVLLLTSAALARTDAVNPDTFVNMGCRFSGTVPPSLQKVPVAVQSSWTLNNTTQTRDTIISGDHFYPSTSRVFFPKNGTNVKFKVTPTCSGYVFKAVVWSAGINIITPRSDTTINFWALGAVYTANFNSQAIKYKLTVASVGGQILLPATADSVLYGAVTKIKVSPLADFHFVKWVVTSGTATVADSTKDSTTIILKSGDVTVTAICEPSTGTITPTVRPVSVRMSVPQKSYDVMGRALTRAKTGMAIRKLTERGYLIIR